MPHATEYDAHFLAIGRMLVLFQSLEATLKDGLVLLIDNRMGTTCGQLAYATVSELSFAAVARLAAALPTVFTAERVGSTNAESRKCLEEALNDAEKALRAGIKLACEAEQRRNQLVHSRWFISPGFVSAPGTMSRMKSKTKAGRMTVDFESESISDIDANTDKARQAQALLSSALQDYRQIVLHPW